MATQATAFTDWRRVLFLDAPALLISAGISSRFLRFGNFVLDTLAFLGTYYAVENTIKAIGGWLFGRFRRTA